MSRLLLVLLGIVFLLSHAAESGEVGVCYGTMGNNLPTLSCGAQLLVDKGVGRVRVYDPDPAEMLTAFANTGIKVAVTLPNELIADAAGDPECAEEWVRDNVEAFYPETLIENVCVGNEVFKSASELTPQLLPAMKNVYRALDSLGLADAVKVTTPVAFDAFNNTFPPSASVFRDDLAESVMCPMLEFLDQTGSYLTVNLFPYIAYLAHPESISLDYLLLRPNKGVHDPGSNLMYYNLFDAQLDAVYYAMDKLLSSGSRARGNGGRKLLQQGPHGQAKAGETNHPHTGHSGSGPPHKQLQAADDDGGCAGAACQVLTVENSKAYVGNLINRVVQGERVTGNRGTPYRPNADIDVYIFALFNENLKEGPEEERNFGLFYPDQTPVYNVDFRGGNVEDTRWCVANPAVGDASLNQALSYACGNGANCSAIQSGGRCFKPDTAVAHASYAFNDFFQRNGRSSVACNFSGAGYVVYQQPKIGNCELPSTPTNKI